MQVVVGVDAGGTNTRALAVRFDGEVVGYAQAGGGNPEHEPAFRENVRRAIAEAAAGCGLERVARVVSGIAGLDHPEDHVWAAEATDVAGLRAVRVQVNDADIAHYGALGGSPGIVSIQGTGSMILAHIDDGRRLRNFDYRHYAAAAAPATGHGGLMALLVRGPEAGDASFVRRVLAYWEVDSLEALREKLSRASDWDGFEFRRRHGGMAPIVTRSAEEGSPLAAAACRERAAQIVEGVRLLGRHFRSPEVRVALIGSCVGSPFMRRAVAEGLDAAPEKGYRLVGDGFPPLVGAILMALDQEGAPLAPEAAARLARTIGRDGDPPR